MTDIHLGIVTDRRAPLNHLVDIPASLVDETLSWRQCYHTLSYEEALPGTGKIWLLYLPSPRDSMIKYYAHAFHTLSMYTPYILLGEVGDSKSRNSTIFRWISSLQECTVFRQSEVRQLSGILRRVLDSSPETILQAVALNMRGLEVLFCDGESRVIEPAYVKFLLGRGNDKTTQVAIGRDRTFIRIDFMGGAREFVPSDMLRAASHHSMADRDNASIRSAALTGKRIHHVRKKAMLTQSELGDKIGKSRHAIMRFESGEILPKVSDLELIAKAFRMELLDLLSVPLPAD